MRARLFAAVVASLALACSALVDLDGLSGDAGDAGTSDAGPDALVVKCKGLPSCAVPSICCGLCVDDDSGSCNFDFSCTDPASCGGVPIGCSDPGSCAPGAVCCAQLGANSAYFEESDCLTVAECDASAPSVVLCDPNAAAPCPNGGTCLLSNTGYFAQLYECR